MPKARAVKSAKPADSQTRPAHTQSRPSGRILPWLAAIVAAQVIPYIPSLKGDFTLDDWDLIVRDPLAHSILNAPHAFLTSFLRGYFGPDVSYYRPLVTITFQANWAMAGESPLVFRLTNLLLAVITCVLVFLLAKRITGSTVAAGIGGLAFAVLPNHSEAVAWVSGRTDLMACLFTVAALLTFAAAQDAAPRRRAGLMVATGLLFLCGLFSKETALTAPILALGYLWIFADRIRRRDLLKWAVVFLLPFVFYFVVRRYAVHVNVVKHLDFMLGKRLLGIGIAYAAYLRMMFVPLGSCAAYDVFPLGMKYPALAVAAWGAPVGLGALAVWARRRLPAISFGALWILVTLLPVSNILPTSGPLPTDRFVFLASVGSSIVLGWLVWLMYQYQPPSIRVWKAVVVTLVVWFVVYCAALAVVGARIYQSNVAWAQAIAEGNGRLFRSWSGLHFWRAGLLQNAAKEFEAAIRSEPDVVANYCDLAAVWRQLGKPENALRVMQLARERFPATTRIEYESGITYAELGRMREAADAFSRAVELEPRYWPAWRNLGRARMKLGDYPAAVRAYERAFSIQDLGPKGHLELGRAYAGAGESAKARRELEKARSLNPNGPVGSAAADELHKLNE